MNSGHASNENGHKVDAKKKILVLKGSHVEKFSSDKVHHHHSIRVYHLQTTLKLVSVCKKA